MPHTTSGRNSGHSLASWREWKRFGWTSILRGEPRRVRQLRRACIAIRPHREARQPARWGRSMSADLGFWRIPLTRQVPRLLQFADALAGRGQLVFQAGDALGRLEGEPLVEQRPHPRGELELAT